MSDENENENEKQCTHENVDSAYSTGSPACGNYQDCHSVTDGYLCMDCGAIFITARYEWCCCDIHGPWMNEKTASK
tara:strand:+ start:157 stop:384 length:228 start_codon:yes stop_codon:yes gene_type:complete